jgi:outer membrane protein assembly factor BamA
VRITLIIAVFYFNLLPCNSQDHSTKNASVIDTSKTKIGVLPSGFYSPETRLGLGGFVYTYFNTSKFNNNKRSNTQSYLFYTMNKQFSFENDYQLWFKNNTYLFSGNIDFSHFPDFFYGVSNNTIEDEKILISFNIIKIHSKNLIKLQKQLYAGIDFQYQKLYKLDTKQKNNTTIDIENYVGGKGYGVSGLGPIVIYDNRDNPLNPTNGSYFESSYQYFGKWMGSQMKFNSFIMDIRKYNTFFNKLIWNGSVYMHFNSGEVPFRMLATIGGARHLRGYYRGRFRDNNMIILQKEIRMPIYKWFGIAAFGGLGSVATTLSNFKSNDIHYSYGLGLRLRINKKENTNIRLDYGLTKDSRGIYIVFAEAF